MVVRGFVVVGDFVVAGDFVVVGVVVVGVVVVDAVSLLFANVLVDFGDVIKEVVDVDALPWRNLESKSMILAFIWAYAVPVSPSVLLIE
jgi:hypothetical protein